MLINRAIPAALRLASVTKTPWPVCVRNYSADNPYKGYVYPTMDELPVPCGDWNEEYNRRQRKYNLHMIFGAGFFAITCVCAYYSGLMRTYFEPPEKPAPRPEPKC